MRILSMTAQKPDSTGSGVFLSELVKGFADLNCAQAVLCGTMAEDILPFQAGVEVFPVCYSTEELPFPVCGMSDEMPYESTRYRDMDEKMTEQLMDAFGKKLRQAVESFHPDVILCHHLYFSAALAVRMYPEIPVYGQCHGSDLRQIETNPWQREWIKEGVRKLRGVFALHETQKEQICRIYQLPEDRVRVMGTGYNGKVFFRDEEISRDPEKNRILFAGKMSEKKGVYSLLHSLKHLENPENTELCLAGGCGSPEELEKLQNMALEAPCRVSFLGKLNQKELAREMNRSHVFVLPSFYEGLPLVLIEAMACGMKTVCTDLPGIRPWLFWAIPGCDTIFLTPPRMHHTDEPVPEELEPFERRLAEALNRATALELRQVPSVDHLSWNSLCRKLLDIFEKQEDTRCW